MNETENPNAESDPWGMNAAPAPNQASQDPWGMTDSISR